MIVIRPDHDRRIEIPGVPAPVRRPVDIDQARTGFTALRTLRIYRFDQQSVIEGHAEEDEVFLVVIAGSVELTILEAGSVMSTNLSFPGMEPQGSIACAAYLPPHAAYKLIATTDADVAYARATPTDGGRPAKFFSSAARAVAPGVTLILQEMEYAQRLRLRIFEIEGREQDVKLAPVPESNQGLVHIRTAPGEGVAAVDNTRPSTAWLESGDTLAVTPSDSVTLHIARGSAAWAMVVFAT